MSTCVMKLKPETEVVIVCWECLFAIPSYAKKPLQRDSKVRVDAATCPVCHSSYLLNLEQTRRTDLSHEDLRAVKNRNR